MAIFLQFKIINQNKNILQKRTSHKISMNDRQFVNKNYRSVQNDATNARYIAAAHQLAASADVFDGSRPNQLQTDPSLLLKQHMSSFNRTDSTRRGEVTFTPPFSNNSIAYDDLAYHEDENSELQAPSILSKDFFERQKPLMVEEIYDNEQFSHACDAYFQELGYACIFTMYEVDILPQMIRKTIDTIYSQLYVSRAQIGKYTSKYSQKRDIEPITFTKHFQDFATNMWKKMSGKVLNGDDYFKTLMRAFLQQTIEEFDYLESQIQLVEYNIDKNVKPKSWDGSNLPENLFNLVILDGSKRHQEGHQREYRRCLIGYLKRIVFKFIIGIERVEFYVHGWIRGRDSKLRIRDAYVHDIIEEKDEPFGELGRANWIKAHAAVAHPSGSKISETKNQNIVHDDLLGSFKLQFLIKEQIDYLRNNNIQKKCLADRLLKPKQHETLKPDMLGKPFSRQDKELQQTKVLVLASSQLVNELYKWQKALVQKNKKKGPQDDVANQRIPEKLRKLAIDSALSEQFDCDKMEAQVELLKDLLFTLSLKNTVVDEAAQQHLFITICASRITCLQSNTILLRSMVNKVFITLYNMENFSKENLKNLITRLQNLMMKNLNLRDRSKRHLEHQEGIYWRALPTILCIITEINREHNESSFHLIKELMSSINIKLDNCQTNDSVIFYFEQILIPNIPLIFELFVEESEMNHLVTEFTIENANGFEELDNFIEKVLLRPPQFTRLIKELIDNRLNENYAMSDEVQAKTPLQKNESVLGIVKNSYVLRMMAMAEILSGRAITRLPQSQQCNIVTKFCKFLDEQLQDVRRRQQRSNLLQVVRDQNDRIKNEKLVNEKIIFFLSSYFKWELSFNQLEWDRSSQNSAGLGYLTQNIDLFFHFVENKTCVLINKWVTQVVLFRLLNSIKHEELEQLFQLRFKNRIESSLDKIANDLHNDQYSFQEPFQYYHKRIRCKLYANFSYMMSQQLLEILKQKNNDVFVNEYQNVFAQTWFIMIFTVYDIREYELTKLEKQTNNRVYDSKTCQSKKVQNIVFLYGKTLWKAKRQDLLMPTENFAERNLKSQYLPKLIKQVKKDVRLGKSDALDGLLLFLCAYTEVTAKLINRGKDDIRQINLLAQLVKLCNELKSADQYKHFARNYEEMVDCHHDSFLMKKFKQVVELSFGFKIKEKQQTEELKVRQSQDQWNVERYLMKICQEFRVVEKRIFVCQLNENDRSGISHTFYGVYCSYKLLEAKMTSGILCELTMKASSVTGELINAYNELREETLKNIVNGDEEQENYKDRVEQSFLVAERAFLHKEIYEYALMEILQRKSERFMNVNNNIQEFGDQVIRELEGMNHQQQIIEKHRQSNFPLQAAEIKLAELQRLFNRTQTKNHQQFDDEERDKDKILNRFNQLYQDVLKRSEDFISVPVDRLCQQKKRVARPEIPWYYHIQFYGKEFQPELTKQEHGYLVRGLTQAQSDTKSDYWQIKAFLQALFPHLGDRLEVETRFCFTENIQGHKNLDCIQENPLIVIMEKIKPLTSKRQAKYGDMSKVIKSIRLDERQQEEKKRENFQKSDNLNFKRYFTKKVTSPNQNFVKMAKDKIEGELEKLCGEERPELIPKQVVKELYKIVKNWQGDFVGDGHAKTDEEFQKLVWEKAAVQANVKAVKTHIVIEQVEKMYQALKYDDLRLYIFEVPKQFPNGFFMQPIKKLTDTRIHGARFADSMVHSWTNEIQSFSNKDKHQELYKAIEGKLIANVQGGLASYIKIFFTKDGYHQLNKDNEQYLGVLRLFTSLDKLFPIIQEGIDKLHQELLRRGDQNHTWKLFELQDILDKNTKRHYENLTNLDIDEKLRKEAAKIFQEGQDDVKFENQHSD